MEYKEKIQDAITGEITWRDFTSTEIAEAKEGQLRAEAEAQAEAIKVAAKAAAQAKLSALGLTTDDLTALGL